MRYPVGPLALLLAVIASGCDLFGREDRTIEVTGRVVLAGTGEPLGGLKMTIEKFRLTAFTIDSMRTDAEGRFSLRYDAVQEYAPGRLSTPYGYTLEVNAWPYDERYTGLTRSLFPGRIYDFGTIELERRGDPRP